MKITAITIVGTVISLAFLLTSLPITHAKIPNIIPLLIE